MKTIHRIPNGWDEARIREVIDHYENQTDEEAAAEHEAALAQAGETLLPVPNALVPKVQKLIAQHRRNRAA